MDAYLKMLLANRAWVEEKLELRPDFFTKSAEGQQPEFLWIGCSDSRVPAEDITGSEPGELFVHRNIANQVQPADLNAGSVLQYAVDVLKVRHVIVCGHYLCGGMAHAMHDAAGTAVDEWLEPARQLRRRHAAELEGTTDAARRLDRLVELNVTAQLQNLAETRPVSAAWASGSPLQIHAWVYDLRNGTIRELESRSK